MGQVIEYLEDRLYLASYNEPPKAGDLLFPPSAELAQPRSPVKRARAAIETPALKAIHRKPPVYFSVDDSLLYNAFHHDFGPLHIGHMYRFALEFHEILGAKEAKERPVVFWSRADPRSRANAMCLLACYMVLVQGWAPHLALAPISQVDPPLMPFRDAGYSQADYSITVQDVVYGVWRAKEERCCVLQTFSLDEYETYERVENGDFNWISPHFLAFASPQTNPVARTPEGTEMWAALPKTLDAVDKHPGLNQPFRNVLKHFSERNIGLVVRLNSALYNPSFFEALGIQHLDMIFEDGTCPPLSMVRKFIRLAHETIVIKKKSVAVHCKAGLGRTGCLIGAYLIYRHGFSANEVIAYMRFMRPGMVVGPQQHWLHLNQGVFREWWVEERVERRLRKAAALAAQAGANASGHANHHQPSTPIRAMQKTSLGQSSNRTGASTPPNRTTSRTPLGEMDQDQVRDQAIGAQEDYLPAPTPGQPRKTPRASASRHHPYTRSISGVQQTVVHEEQEPMEVKAEVSATHRTSQGPNESDEEWHLRVRNSSRKAPTSASPDCRRDQARSYSQQTTTTTTMTVYQVIDNDASNDVENIGAAVGRTKQAYDHVQNTRASSASGILTKVRGSSRRAAAAANSVRESGVRKTSGRIGSIGGSSTTAAAVSAARKISGM